MNKFSEYLSVKIGLIVTGVAVMLHQAKTSEALVFVVSLLVSYALWRAVWDFAADAETPPGKHRIFFAIHVASSTVPSVIGLFYVSA